MKLSTDGLHNELLIPIDSNLNMRYMKSYTRFWRCDGKNCKKISESMLPNTIFVEEKMFGTEVVGTNETFRTLSPQALKILK